MKNSFLIVSTFTLLSFLIILPSSLDVGDRVSISIIVGLTWAFLDEIITQQKKSNKEDEDEDGKPKVL